MGGRRVIRTYDFDEELRLSAGQSQGASVESILLEAIPGSEKAWPACEEDDRNGTDWWVKTRIEKWLSVDAKVRKEDWKAKGHDDLALEIWSVVEKRITGWTARDDKQTDYILWLWTDTGRWCMVPFLMLCHVFRANLPMWESRYKTAAQKTVRGNQTWHSECVFVPRDVIWSAIKQTFGGEA